MLHARGGGVSCFETVAVLFTAFLLDLLTVIGIALGPPGAQDKTPKTT